MLEEGLIALVSIGGTAVITAAGTDAWNGFRNAVARWLGRGDTRREQEELERLDLTARALATADPGGELQQVRARHEAAWRTRLEAALEGTSGAERERAARELSDLLAQHRVPERDSAGQALLAVGGDVDVRADRGSVAGAVIQGGVHIGPPPPPAPSQG